MAGLAINGTRPPEAFEEAALSVDDAARLMSDFGFVAFRTPSSGEAIPDSCVMAILRRTPTLRHFDPEVATFWAFSDGHGRLESIDQSTPMPFAGGFSWGRIQLIDRLGEQNGFVGFGGQLSADPVGTDARIVIFASPAPIVRLRGHSQHEDRLSQEILAFFGRLTPRLWATSGGERLVAAASPSALYAAFLLDAHDRRRLAEPADAEGDGTLRAMQRELELIRAERPESVTAATGLLARLGLQNLR
jgi:hypothetical protein